MSVERECNDNRDQINAFEMSVTRKDSIQRGGVDGEEQEYVGADEIFLQEMNPLNIGRQAFQTTTAVGLGVVETVGKAVETTVQVPAK